MIFKYSDYRILVTKLKSLGKCVTFSEWDGTNSYLLRFDVDFDLQPAFDIARINEELAVKSTFFVLTTCHFYNPSSSANRTLLQNISATGAEIGLHFDPTIYPEITEEQLHQKVDNEAALLSSIIGKEIHSVSLHNPSIHNKYPLFSNYVNAYDSKFASDKTYISDSRMEFRGKNIFDFVENIKNSSVQITLHPMHYGDVEQDYATIMLKHISKYIHSIDENFKVNSTYVKQTNPSLLTESNMIKLSNGIR